MSLIEGNMKVSIRGDLMGGSHGGHVDLPNMAAFHLAVPTPAILHAGLSLYRQEP